MKNKTLLQKRLKEITSMLTKVDVTKGCSAVEQRIALEKEKKKIINEMEKD